MSDTPRTDAAVSYAHCTYVECKYPNDIPVVSKGFAQALERESDAYRLRILALQRTVQCLENEIRDSGRTWANAQGGTYGD